MKYFLKSNVEILFDFENICFQVAHFPCKKSLQDRLFELEQELAFRLQIDRGDLEKMRKGQV